MSRIRFPEMFSLLSTAGLTALAIPESVPGASVQGTPPLALNFTLLIGNQSPQSDQQCILSGERHKPLRVIANDRDAKSARAEEASLRLRHWWPRNQGNRIHVIKYRPSASLRSST